MNSAYNHSKGYWKCLYAWVWQKTPENIKK